MGDDIKLENYKKNVARILDIWGDEAAAVAKELTPIESELKKREEYGFSGRRG
jgi:hypothetical protein